MVISYALLSFLRKSSTSIPSQIYNHKTKIRCLHKNEIQKSRAAKDTQQRAFERAVKAYQIQGKNVRNIIFTN
jgi:hypothetical protein